MSTYRAAVLASSLFTCAAVQGANFYRLSANECAALAHYGQIVAEQRDASRAVTDLLKENYALRSDFASGDLFGATIDMIQWVFERPAFEPAVVFEMVWHQCADNGGRVPMRRAANDA